MIRAVWGLLPRWMLRLRTRFLQQALTALARLAHRGATAADGKSSDGVGVMTAVPRDCCW